VVFENTSPSDGLIYINGQEISGQELISFLRFEFTITCYFKSNLQEVS